jgi:5-keto 4-deoxyuronate isomerase
MFLKKTVLMKKLCCNLNMLTVVEGNRDVTFRASDLLFNIKFYVRCHYVLSSKPSFDRSYITAE